MATGTSEPSESEIVLDSRKAKVVAFFAAAPSAAYLFLWLRRLDLLPGTSFGSGDTGARIDAPGLWALGSAVILAVAVIPLYFTFKIWLRPTLKNLRSVPFIAAFWWIIGVPFIFVFLRRFEWISFKDTEQELLGDVGGVLSLLLMLGAYFLVKNAMVIWFRTPELAQSGLQTNSRRNLWWWYCFCLWFCLWGVLMGLGDDLFEQIDSAGSYYYDDPVVGLLIEMVILGITVCVAMCVYKIGLRPLGLRPK